MTDGELKKRIQKQFISNRWSQPSDIFPILNKAKQEWKKIEADIEHTFSFRVDAKDAWFERWFGSAEK